IKRLEPVEVIGAAEGVSVRDVQFDHRRLQPGDMFCCLSGEHRDGHDFAAAAVAAGASSLLCEHPVEAAVPQVVTGHGRARAAMAEAACAAHLDPASRLSTTGVTGTNGKTTTTYLLQSVLAAAGRPTAVIGTLTGARTTPEAPDLQRQFAEAVYSGSSAVVLEVTSHALVQHRVDGYVHDVAVFTNLSQDHLDYHGTMERYFEAKALLFTPEHARQGVVSADDAYGQRLLDKAGIAVTPFALSDAGELEISLTGSRFLLDGHGVELHLTGEPNVRNALAAAAAARTLGVPAEAIAAGLTAAAPVPGRFETVANALGLAVIVDFAHTPAALTESLAAVARLADGGRLIVVFGAGGDRDAEKRPLMGAAVSTAADIALVTSDNPRHEDPRRIIEEIVAGCTGPAEVIVEPDRRAAISLALATARVGDLVVVTGKGHEKTQQVGDEMQPFDDADVIATEATALAAGGGRGGDR
ncbi:MAG TPA: UDP-N-acetylmuramoyl-L-alanyl-D-glutamate--2,6-diaminopimelate ligase, partial [Acidimicrobiales bacterium]|nr:UDP-N-acetylmuramoyl-L-alanyl-D-glutamate--2,6-diaminopimelate ligase [Acidimicrobiales bacterium]